MRKGGVSKIIKNCVTSFMDDPWPLHCFDYRMGIRALLEVTEVPRHRPSRSGTSSTESCHRCPLHPLPDPSQEPAVPDRDSETQSVISQKNR